MVESGGLLIHCTPSKVYRGFKSRPLRQFELEPPSLLPRTDLQLTGAPFTVQGGGMGDGALRSKGGLLKAFECTPQWAILCRANWNDAIRRPGVPIITPISMCR